MFSTLQKYQILDGAEKGLTLSEIEMYADPSYSYELMSLMKDAFLKGISNQEMQGYVDASTSPSQLYETLYQNVFKPQNRRVNYQGVLKYLGLFSLLLFAIYFTLFYFMKPFDHNEIIFDKNFKLSYGEMFDPKEIIKETKLRKYASIEMIEPMIIDEVGQFLIPYTIREHQSISKHCYILDVVDETPPTLKLKKDRVYLLKGIKFQPDLYILEAIDEIDGDLTDQVKCQIDKIDDQRSQAVYTLSDSSNNTTTKKLIVYHVDLDEYEKMLGENN